jgi:hypothetical protein
VLLAGTTATVDALSQAIIDRLIAAGDLADTPIAFGGRTIRVGEGVVLRRNGVETTVDGEPIAVANGQIGTVLGVDVGMASVAGLAPESRPS